MCLHTKISCCPLTAARKVAFNLVEPCCSEDSPKGNFRLACDCFCSKFETSTIPSLLQLYKIAENSKLDLADKEPDIWITSHEALRQRMDELDLLKK